MLVNVTGGSDLMLFEVRGRSTASVPRSTPMPTFCSAAHSPEYGRRVRVSVVATGIDAEACVRFDQHSNVTKFPPRQNLLSPAAVEPIRHRQGIVPSPARAQMNHWPRSLAFAPKSMLRQPSQAATVQYVSTGAEFERSEPLS